ncbi:MAG: hypothetical protein WA108_02635 [Thiobacillus sp.]
MRKYFCLAALLFSTSAVAGNYATCILDRMPGTQNDAVANSVMRLCYQQYPDGHSTTPQGAGRGWFGYASGAECTAKKAAGTPNNRAARLILIACNRLYNKP